MPDRFEKRLERGPPVVTDGGMGVLVSSAVSGLRCPEEANIKAPESVVTLHTSFISAGAELIETNTFGANRHKLRHQFLEDELAAINENGVKLAREARDISGRDVYIAGSIGPLGELRGLTPAERGPIFAEQAGLLEGRGVDLFMVETFFDLDELTTAIEAVQGVSQLPIVAMLTFDEDAETFGGVSAKQAIDRLADYDLAAVGANHGAGLHAALAALEAMGDGRPLAALPNVGLASLAGGRVIYPHATPEYFAEFAAQARALGARVIGGCCGTTPIEIAASARANALMAAIAIERSCGIETIPHVTPRDTSVMGLQSQLLAAHAEGVRNVLSVTGDPPHVGDYPGSRGVYEVDSIGLSQMVARLNSGEDFNGKAIDAPTSFFLGVAVNPSADDLETELDRFRQKVEAGAPVAVTPAPFHLSFPHRL